MPKTALGSLPKSCLLWNCFTRWGKKRVVIFSSPFFPYLSSQCLQEVTLPWFEWPHTLGELLLPSPPPHAAKYSFKQISFNAHCKPEGEGFHFTSCCCSFLQNLAKMQWWKSEHHRQRSCWIHISCRKSERSSGSQHHHLLSPRAGALQGVRGAS